MKLSRQDREERSAVQAQYASPQCEILTWGKRDVEVDRTYLNEWFTGEPYPPQLQLA